jgi:hypothetical protein
MAIVLGDRFVNVSLPAGSSPYACPCCGYLTLDARGEHETCQVCFWEDDGQDDHDAAVVRGGPNKDLSLTWARNNFAAFGPQTNGTLTMSALRTTRNTHSNRRRSTIRQSRATRRSAHVAKIFDYVP